jgi:mono/diheme cytochrome c family protein
MPPTNGVRNQQHLMKKIALLITLVTCLQAQAQKMDLKSSMERGLAVYIGQCITCHMPAGEGLESVYPALAKNRNMNRKEYLAQLIIKGIRGPIDGRTYSGEMPPAALTDQDMADVMNYVRNSWGNKAAPVLPKEIQPALKVEVKGFQPY